MLNKALAPFLLEDLTSGIKHQPFSICIYGSNDTGLEKMNPITVRIYNARSGKIVHHFLDMCQTIGATAETGYIALNEKISQLLDTSKPWHDCNSVGEDNTSANIEIHNLLKTRIGARNHSINFSGYVFHIIHNAVQKRL